MTLKAPRLKIGDSIGIIAPAGPVTPSEIRPGIDLLESAGFKTVVSPNLYERRDYLAGDDETRLQDLYGMFEDPDVKAVICARGGYGTLRLLRKIDFNRIRRHPKLFVGYSDITALLWAFYHMAELVTFHGPTIKDLHNNNLQNLENLFSLITSDRPFSLDIPQGVIIREGHATGRLLGGNLCLICHLLGTPLMPSLEGAILFIEEKREPLYRIDRMMTHLRLSGRLEGLTGLMVGDFTECGDKEDVYRIVAETLSEKDIPVLGGLPIGHGAENTALPIGVRALLDTDQLSLSLLEPCVTT